MLKDLNPPPSYCCVLVLYKPAPNIELKIKQYAILFPFLCVVDNSPQSIIDDSFKSSFSEKKVLFIQNSNIGGIARALNLGAKEAMKQEFPWMMTLDQDSELTDVALRTMWEVWRNNGQEKIAMIAPYLKLKTDFVPNNIPDYEFPLTVMTSGTILSMEAYRKVGPFDEKLVIDYVDHEYCLRLHIRGYKIIRANKAILNHELGSGVSHNLLGRKLLSTNHSALRRYYITRNRLYTAFRYKNYFPKFFWHEIRLTCSDFIIIVLYEENKWLKTRMIFRGIKDFCRGKTGANHD